MRLGRGEQPGGDWAGPRLTPLPPRCAGPASWPSRPPALPPPAPPTAACRTGSPAVCAPMRASWVRTAGIWVRAGLSRGCLRLGGPITPSSGSPQAPPSPPTTWTTRAHAWRPGATAGPAETGVMSAKPSGGSSPGTAAWVRGPGRGGADCPFPSLEVRNGGCLRQPRRCTPHMLPTCPWRNPRPGVSKTRSQTKVES